MVRNKYRGRGVPMFVWLPTLLGTICAIIFFSWLNEVLDHRTTGTVPICYTGRIVEGVVKCDDRK